MSVTRLSRRVAAAGGAVTLAVVLCSCGLGGSTDASRHSGTADPTGAGTVPGVGGPAQSDNSGTVDDAIPLAPLPTGSAGTPAGPVPHPDKVDARNATAVAQAAVTAMESADTAIDKSWYDVQLRGAPYLDATYLADLRQARPVSGPGADWLEWAQHRAYLVVTTKVVSEYGQPADSLLQASRMLTVTAAPTGRDGWKGDPTQTVAFVTLTRPSSDSPWKVTDVNEDN